MWDTEYRGTNKKYWDEADEAKVKKIIDEAVEYWQERLTTIPRPQGFPIHRKWEHKYVGDPDVLLWDVEYVKKKEIATAGESPNSRRPVEYEKKKKAKAGEGRRIPKLFGGVLSRFGPQSEKVPATVPEYKCGDAVIPEKLQRAIEVCDSVDVDGKRKGCTRFPAGPGVTDKDMVILFQVHDCEETTQAHASVCQRDECGKPVIASVTICERSIKDSIVDANKGGDVTYSETKRWDDLRLTLIHEISHALGFNSSGMAYWRGEEGEPRVPSQWTKGRLHHEGQMRYNCVTKDGKLESSTWGSGTRTFVNLVAAGILRLESHWGNGSGICQKCADLNEKSEKEDVEKCLRASTDKKVDGTPLCVFSVATPMVTEKAREHFGCDELQGMPLDNTPSSECQFYGSHWERLLIRGEVMAAASNIRRGI